MRICFDYRNQPFYYIRNISFEKKTDINRKATGSGRRRCRIGILQERI